MYNISFTVLFITFHAFADTIIAILQAYVRTCSAIMLPIEEVKGKPTAKGQATI